ncbi:MAG: lantibiotic dehydratase [Pseudonocardia sp.]
MRAAVRLPSAVAPWPDLTGDTDEHVTQWCRWLRQVWASEGFAASVEVASPTLARRVRDVCDGRRVRGREVRRAVLAVIRYLQRATSRATPFGLFAGVAPARLGPAPVVWFAEGHHAVARVDAAWLDQVITRVETSHELRHRLLVVRNDLAFVRDDRLVVGCQQHAGAASGTEPAEVSVRYTEAVGIVLEAAQAPIRLGELAGKLAADFPDRPDFVINGMLAGLVAQRMLVTNLRPPMTTTDPLAHVIEALAAVGADTVPEVADLLDELREIHADLTRHNDAASPTQGRDLRAHAARRMAAIVTAERPVTVDLRLDAGLVLPRAVAREAENTANALVRLTPHPFGTPAWQDYHRRFCERYGLGALVGVQELLDVDSGLGFPAGYRDSRLNHPTTSALSERDAALLALAQNAAMRQRTEVVLNDTMIANLTAGDPDNVQAQPHAEVRCRIYASSAEALGRGEFQLAITGASRAAGTITGRFLDLFDADDRDRMFSTYAGLPTVSEDALRVQVSGPAMYPRAENIARGPVVLPHLLSLAEHHPDGTDVISFGDLAVSADVERLYLISLSRGRPVEPTVFSAVELTNHAHPLLRFLCEIATARTAACVPFSWGQASRLPFLPRIRYRRSILSPAMWTLAATDLPGSAAPWRDWVTSLVAWRDQFHVPVSVYLGDDDRRIRVDLNEPAHLAVLRTDLERNGHATVREAPDASALGWINGRAHDIVIPLAATAQPAAPRRARLGSVLSREHGHLPGSGEWLYVKLYGHPDRQTAILSTHLPTLLSTWDMEPEWWFLRYHDPEKHLRLRIRLRDADDFGQTAARIAEWTAGLRRLGLVGQVQWDTYYPETGRFGRDAAMAAAESLFAADSAAVIAQLTATNRGGGPHPYAVVAASMVDLAIAAAGGVSNGMRWLISHLRTHSISAPPREVHDQAVRLANPHNDWAALRAIPGGADIAASWTLRRAALARYRDALAAAEGIAADTVLADLLHLHVVRMAGLSPDSEGVCVRLARAAALSWTTRTQGAL